MVTAIQARPRRAAAKFSNKKTNEKMNKNLSNIEKFLAIAAFLSADAMGFLAVIINDDNNILSGQLWFIAQMLLLCATILGIDYKLKKWNK